MLLHASSLGGGVEIDLPAWEQYLKVSCGSAAPASMHTSCLPAHLLPPSRLGLPPPYAPPASLRGCSVREAAALYRGCSLRTVDSHAY